MKSCNVNRSTRLLLVCLVVALCFGCGRYKEELDSAKHHIDELNGEIRRLTEANATLDKEKSRLGDEIKALSNKTVGLEKDVAELKKSKASLEDENAKLQKRSGELQEQMNSLDRQKTELEVQVQGLKKGIAELTPTEKPSQIETPEKAPGQMPGQSVSKLSEKLSPCDAVIEFMKRSGEIVRQHKGEQRKKMLQQVKEELVARMKEAPPKAVKAAEAWVKELTTYWDKPHEKFVYNLLTKRNEALDACGKTPEEAGF